MRVYFKSQNNELFEVTGNGKNDSITTTSELASNAAYDFDHIYLFKYTADKIRQLNYIRFSPYVIEEQDDQGVGRVKFVKAPTSFKEKIDAIMSSTAEECIAKPGTGINVGGVPWRPDPQPGLPTYQRLDFLGVCASSTGFFHNSICPETGTTYWPIKSITGKAITITKENTMTRPLTKEEAKLRRQAAETEASLKQIADVLEKLEHAIQAGNNVIRPYSCPGLKLAPELVSAVNEKFPFIKLVPKTNKDGEATGVLFVEFVD